MTPPPEAERVYTNADMATPGRAYSQGPHHQHKTLKKAAASIKNPVGGPTLIRTAMAARRVALGLTQGEVADYAGSTVRTIASLESGHYPYNPKRSTLNAVATVLKMPVETLMMPPTGPTTERKVTQ
jgi:DNA-binding XRE family transcriptional regulator